MEGFFLLSQNSTKKSPDIPDNQVAAREGIHWHPKLTITIKGEKQTIPANIGIGPQYQSNPLFDSSMGMTAIHTHEDAKDGIIHLEFEGLFN